MLSIALYRPAIPPNTGSIARQCVGMNARLHIIGPAGFDMSDRAVKRAGLDYWNLLDLTVHDSEERFIEWIGSRQPWIVTTLGSLRYDSPDFRDEDILIFGSEIHGLPRSWIDRWHERALYIPMPGRIRNYNLSNTVSIVLAHAGLKSGIFDAMG